MDIRKKISDEELVANDLRTRANQAINAKAEVGTVLQGIESAKQAVEQQLAKCRNQKSIANKEQQQKLQALKAALKALLAADLEYTDAHIVNEALRLQIAALEEKKREVASLQVSAQAAVGSATKACQ